MRKAVAEVVRSVVADFLEVSADRVQLHGYRHEGMSPGSWSITLEDMDQFEWPNRFMDTLVGGVGIFLEPINSFTLGLYESDDERPPSPGAIRERLKAAMFVHHYGGRTRTLDSVGPTTPEAVRGALKASGIRTRPNPGKEGVRVRNNASGSSRVVFSIDDPDLEAELVVAIAQTLNAAGFQFSGKVEGEIPVWTVTGRVRRTGDRAQLQNQVAEAEAAIDHDPEVDGNLGDRVRQYFARQAEQPRDSSQPANTASND